MLEFGLFSSFWTTLTFHLSGEPFYFQSNIIGLFGLVAIGGALLAPIIGKRSDKGEGKRVRLTAAGLMIISVLLMMFLEHSIIALIAAVFLLDLGAQAIQVTNVAMIYSLDESSHSRINTIYMTAFFTGGAMGTLIGVYCWKLGGWTWVTGEMLLSALIMTGMLIREKRRN
jgi:MFS family permease